MCGDIKPKLSYNNKSARKKHSSFRHNNMFMIYTYTLVRSVGSNVPNQTFTSARLICLVLIHLWLVPAFSVQDCDAVAEHGHCWLRELCRRMGAGFRVVVGLLDCFIIEALCSRCSLTEDTV